MSTSLAPLFRHSVGFDRLDSLFEDVLRGDTSFNYPPYDIVRDDNGQYRLIMALAGFKEEDITLTAQRGKLVVSGSWPKTERSDGNSEWLHRGIARRAFERSFQLAEHVEVKEAALTDGLLTVTLEQVVPEADRPRQIAINRS